MPSILGANSVSGYQITNSLRLDAGSSSFLGRNQVAPTQAGQIYTISVWSKICFPNGQNATILYGGYPSGSGSTIDDTILMHNVSSKGLFWQLAVNDSTVLGKNADSHVLRDISAWYHIVLSVDTTQGTASNRWKLYLNNVDITSTLANGMPDQNQVHYLNQQYGGDGSSQNTHHIGRQGNTSNYSDMYIADFAFVDGTALTPTSFGETDDNGEWKPKKPDVSAYGDNGWLLEFKQTGTSANSSGIGADTSGNDNHFTVTNLAADHITEDTPTNNFATLNPLSRRLTNNAPTYSEGNVKLTGQTGDGQNNNGIATIQHLTSGKWYFECKATLAANGNFGVGISDNPVASNGNAASDSNHVWYNKDGTINYGTSSSGSYGNSYTNGDIIGIAFDLDNGAIYFYKNGTIQNSGTAARTDLITTMSKGYTPIGFNNKGVSEFNFGNPSFSISSGNSDANGYGNFEYAVPSGYYAICTKNLAKYG